MNNKENRVNRVIIDIKYLMHTYTKLKYFRIVLHIDDCTRRES